MWPRIAAAAEFPLLPAFAEPASGLLFNRREYWERHAVHGIAPGIELVHQVYVSAGLRAAAAMARRTGRDAHARRWIAAAERLAAATLAHPTHALVSAGRLVKRNHLDGTVQDLVSPLPGSLMPDGVPLMREGQHRLNPDTCVALPIVLRFVDPASTLARTTLDSLAPLWNQGWTDGGYGRYDMSSEPDSPGGWPFASLFVARAAVEAGLGERAWPVIDWLGRVPGSPAGSWFEFYGDRISPPFPQVGVVPWTWSEILALGCEQVLGIRHETGSLCVRPHLLPGLDHAAARVPMCGGELSLRVSRERRPRPVTRLNVDGRPVRETADVSASIARAALRGTAADLEIVLPTD
jgi:GH15 family glucan-1,4-alpha-glucosidase